MGYIPLWVLVNVLTFEIVTNFYLNMKEHDKIDISKQFNLHYIKLHKYMNMLGFACNKCAHDERFYDIRFTQNIHTKSIKQFNLLQLPRDSSGSFIKGTSDAYALAIIFKRLLNKQDFDEFFASIETIINKLSAQLHTITINNILDVMGYTNTWHNINEL